MSEIDDPEYLIRKSAVEIYKDMDPKEAEHSIKKALEDKDYRIRTLSKTIF